MQSNVIDKQIRDLVITACGDRQIVGFLKRLGKIEKAEEHLLGAGGGKRGGVPSGLSSAEKLDQLLTFFQASLPAEKAFRAALDIGDIFTLHGEPGRAAELYTYVFEQADAGEHKRLRAEACLRRGDVYGRQSRWKDSFADLNQSRRIFGELRDQEAVARVDNILGTNYAEQGKVKQARTCLQRALRTFERNGNTVEAASLLVNLGALHNIVAEYDEAVAYYQRARSSFEQVGDVARLGALHHNMGMTFLATSAYAQALKEFEQSFSLGSRGEHADLMGLASLGKANVYFRLGDLRAALKLVNQSLNLFRACGDRLSMADGYKVKGMIHREMKKYDFARSYMQTSLRINSELDNRLNTAETYVEIGLLEERRGNTAEAITALEHARAFFRRVGAEHEFARAGQELQRVRTNAA